MRLIRFAIVLILALLTMLYISRCNKGLTEWSEAQEDKQEAQIQAMIDMLSRNPTAAGGRK